jgi:hypothetical protein
LRVADQIPQIVDRVTVVLDFLKACVPEAVIGLRCSKRSTRRSRM